MAAWPSYVCQLPTGWAYWLALSGQMIDADTAFRLGLVQKVCEPDKLIDDCVQLCTTINRNGRLIAAHTMEYIEDKLLYDIQGWKKASKCIVTSMPTYGRVKITTRARRPFRRDVNQSSHKNTMTAKPSHLAYRKRSLHL